MAQQKSNRVQQGAIVGGASGVVGGAAVGWLVGMVALDFPGMAPFMIAGSLLAALAGAGIGGVLGEVVGAFAGMELSKEVDKPATAVAESSGFSAQAGRRVIPVHREVA